MSVAVTVPPASSSGGMRWLELLEAEFDDIFRQLHQGLAVVPESAEEARVMAAGSLSEVNALASVFAQMSRKTKAVSQSNCKLEAMLLDSQSELVQSRTEQGKLERELNGRMLQVRSLEVQLRQNQDMDQTEEARELSTLRAQMELEVEKYHQSSANEERLSATMSLLQEENSILHEYVQCLHADLAAATLSTKYLQKELAGRIQQLQLVVSGVRGPELEKLWRQITTEISLQKNKSLLLAYHARDKTVNRLLQSHQDHLSLRQKVLEYSQLKDEGTKVIQRRAVRVATVEKKESESLGMSITGGSEHGVPILISNLDEGQPAYSCGQLQIGDAILSINDTQLARLKHDEVVSLLKAAGTRVKLEVAYVVGILDQAENESRKDIDAEFRKPPIMDASGGPLPSIDPPNEMTNSSSVSEEPEPSPTGAEMLASAFALSPTSPFASGGLEVANVGLFRYDEMEESDTAEEGGSTPRSVSTIAHEVPYMVLPTERELNCYQGRGYRPAGEGSRNQGTAAHSQRKREDHLGKTDVTSSVGNSEDQPQSESPSVSTTSTNHVPEQSISSSTTPYRPERTSTYHMRLSTVPVQSLIYDSDDIPLFSI